MSFPVLPGDGPTPTLPLEALAVNVNASLQTVCFDELFDAAWVTANHENTTSLVSHASISLLMTCGGAILNGIVSKVIHSTKNCNNIVETFDAAFLSHCTMHLSVPYFVECMSAIGRGVYNATSSCHGGASEELALLECHKHPNLSEICADGVWKEHARRSASNNASVVFEKCANRTDASEASRCRHHMAKTIKEPLSIELCDQVCSTPDCVKECVSGVAFAITEKNIDDTQAIEQACTNDFGLSMECVDESTAARVYLKDGVRNYSLNVV